MLVSVKSFPGIGPPRRSGTQDLESLLFLSLSRHCLHLPVASSSSSVLVDDPVSETLLSSYLFLFLFSIIRSYVFPFLCLFSPSIPPCFSLH